MKRLPTPPGERPNQSDELPESAYTATATIDEQGIVKGWSEGARRLLGYPPSEVVGQPAAVLLVDDVSEAARRASAGQERWSGTLALRHRDGHRLEVRLLAHHRTVDGGIAEWLVVSAVAGKPRTHGDEALMEWTFTQSPCTLAIYDTDLRLVRANADMERVLDLTEADMRGLRPSEIAVGPEGERAERCMRLVLETGEPRDLEFSVRTAGGSRERAWSIAALKDAGGRVRAVCLVAHSVTEQSGTRQRLLVLNEAGTRVGSTLDVARTAQEMADLLVERLVDFVTVDLLDSLFLGDTEQTPEPSGAVILRRAAQQSVLPGIPESVIDPGEVDHYPPRSPPAHCLATGKPSLHQATDQAIRSWAAADPARAAKVRAHRMHSIMIVPLRARGIPLGVSVLARHRRREPFTEDDVLLAEEIGTRAAVCVDNARRYTRERATALALQRSLLPRKLARQAALEEVASRYLPAGTRAGVGGDWFDVIPLSGERVALVVGDVVGHGIQASATMGRLRTAVHTLADVDLPPDELLTHLDDLVTRLSAEEDSADPASEAAGGIGATCLYAVYDPVSRRCSFARAAHPLPAVVTPDGTAYFLDVPAGPPLGLGGLPFEPFETELPEGSLLALYTNGLIETRHHDIDERLDTLRAALSRPAPTLDAICDTVLGDLLPDRHDDDIALLIARTRALHAGQVATWDLPSDPAVVAQARQNATDQMMAWGLDEAVFITELVVSELVTNAIRYGQPPIQLRLIHDRTLICEVSDASSTAPHLRRARVFDEGGRGLLLVAQLTQHWGTRQTPAGKTIWAEQSFPVGVSHTRDQ